MAIHGDGNVLLTPDLVAYQNLFRQKTQLFLPTMATRNYEQYFAQKIGTSIKVKRPYYTTVSQGRVLTTAQKQAMVDLYEYITIDQWWKFALEYNAEEATIALEDLQSRYFDSGQEELAYMYDIAGGNALSQQVGFADYGAVNPSGLTITDVINIRAHATEVSIPFSVQNYGLIHPRDLAGITNEIKGLGAPEGLVTQAIRESFMGRHSHYAMHSTNHLGYMDVLKAGTTLVRGGSNSGNSIDGDGFTSSVKVLNKGQIITFDGVYETQIRGDRKNTGRLMTFTVTADVTANGSGQVAIPISPSLNDGTVTIDDGQGNSVTAPGMQNVTALPANNAAINIVGENNSQYRQSIFMAMGALHFVNVTVVPAKEAAWKGHAMDAETGLSITVHGDFDINDLTSVRRADSYFGVKVLRPEFAIRYISSKV